MLSRYAAPLVVLCFMADTAAASRLPPIETSGSNPVPACATPGRLMSLLQDRNPNLDPRFARIANLYRQHGSDIGIRWDYAFFQMIVETGALKFRRPDGSPSDVHARQNNFAGLGATGDGESGESFDDLSSGVKAHLQHLAIYAGKHIESPVADRTRKVQSWGILKRLHKKYRKPITFANLASMWAPGSRGYARDIASVGSKFYDNQCKRADPAPELDMIATDTQGSPDRHAKIAKAAAPDVLSSRRIEALADKSALGAGVGAKTQDAPNASTSGISIINQDDKRTSDAAPSAPEVLVPRKKPAQLASVATQRPKAATTPAARNKKCRVWTASYGGQKAVLIRSETDDFTNYTVLDVNTGKEAREAAAYIAAYAKGGNKLQDFSSQTQALNKAFELCPDG